MRLTITVSEEFAKDLETYSKKLMMKKSQLVNYLLSTGLSSCKKSFALMDEVSDKVAKELETEVKNSLSQK